VGALPVNPATWERDAAPSLSVLSSPHLVNPQVNGLFSTF
jgi:hypothetical protein